MVKNQRADNCSSVCGVPQILSYITYIFICSSDIQGLSLWKEAPAYQDSASCPVQASAVTKGGGEFEESRMENDPKGGRAKPIHPRRWSTGGERAYGNHAGRHQLQFADNSLDGGIIWIYLPD